MKKTFIIGLAIIHLAASLPWSRDMGTGEEIEIVNGENIDISKVPYQIALSLNDKKQCGGSIINENFVLTAAHCVSRPGLYKIRAGSSNWSSGGVVVKIANITIHPRYINNFKEVDCDVAVLKLEKPLKFTKVIAPAKLADKTYEVKDGETVLVTGWGKSEHGMPEKLQGVELPKINFGVCEKSIYMKFRIQLTENFICALHPDDGHNACQGDSGGPLAHKGTQVGVVSYGGPCNARDAPVAYASVAVFRDWIDSIAGKK